MIKIKPLSDEIIIKHIVRWVKESRESKPPIKPDAADLAPVIALAAQRDAVRQIIEFIEQQAKYNLSGISQLDLFKSPMWQELKELASKR